MRRRQRTLLLSLVLVLGAIYFYRLKSREEAPQTPTPSPSSSSSSPRTSAKPPRPITLPTPSVELSRAIAEADDKLARGSLEGLVLSRATGLPVPRAQVVFTVGMRLIVVDANERGELKFVPQEDGPFALSRVAGKGFVPFEPARGALTFAARPFERVHDVVLYLDPEEVCVVHVVAPQIDAGSAASASVHLEGSESPPVVTNPDGDVAISAHPGAIVSAEHPDLGRGRAVIEGCGKGERTTIRLQRGSKSITGHVIDAKGAAVSNAVVVATIEGASSELGPRLEAHADDDGAFRFSDLDDRRASLVAHREAGGGDSAPEVASPGDSSVVLHLTRGGSIRGLARDKRGGAPIAAFTVFVRRRIGPIERFDVAHPTFFDATGAFTINNLAEGSYAVAVVARGFAPSSERTFELHDGTDSEVLNFDLDQGSRVKGTVIDRDSKRPIAAAHVEVEGLFDTGLPAISSDATSNERGEFLIEGAPVIRLTLFARASAHDSRLISNLSVPATGELGPLTLDLGKVAPGEDPKIELVGVGAVLSAKDDALVVQKVMEGGGAAAAGLSAGDAVVAIDGVTVVTLGFQEAISHIRGPEGSLVHLLIRRGTETRDVTVSRLRLRF
jgi:hypothetical protein